MKYVILNFTKDTRAYNDISNRIREKNPDAEIFIIHFNKETDLDKLKELKENTFLYLVAHSNGTDFFYDKSALNYPSSEIISWPHQKMAEMIASRLTHLKKHRPESNPSNSMLTFSLLVCFAAMPKESSVLQSLAAKFQFELAKYGIFIKVHARQSVVMVKMVTGVTTTSDPDLNPKIMSYYHKCLATNDIEEKEYYKSKCEEYIINDYEKHLDSKVTFQWQEDKSGKLFQLAYDSHGLRQNSKLTGVNRDLEEYAYEKVDFEDLLRCDKYNKSNEINSKNPKFFSFDKKNDRIDYEIYEKKINFLEKLDEIIDRYEKIIKESEKNIKSMSVWSSIISSVKKEKAYVINLYKSVVDGTEIPIYSADKFSSLYKEALYFNKHKEQFSVSKGLCPIIHENYFG